MKKLLALLVAGFMILSIFPGAALAVTETEPMVGDDQEVIEEVIDDVLTPDSPFYFLKRFRESIQILLTFRTESKLALRERLAQERVKEYLALQARFAQGEISEKEYALLERALDDIVIYYQRLIDLLEVQNDPGDEPVYDQDDDDQVDADNEEGEESDDEDGENADHDQEGEVPGDKYDARIAHLQQIMTRVPESAHKGLNRAMENARRQQARKAERAKDLSEDHEVDAAPGADDAGDEDAVAVEDGAAKDDQDLEEQRGGNNNVKDKRNNKEVKNNGKGRSQDTVQPGHLVRDAIKAIRNSGKGR